MRRSSKILIGLAGLLVVLAALTRFVVLPMGSKLPANTKASAHYTGTATLLNAEALKRGDTAHAILKNVPITIERQIKVTSTHGDTAVVADDFTLTGPNGLKSVDNHVYGLDRVSLERRSTVGRHRRAHGRRSDHRLAAIAGHEQALSGLRLGHPNRRPDRVQGLTHLPWPRQSGLRLHGRRGPPRPGPDQGPSAGAAQGARRETRTPAAGRGDGQAGPGSRDAAGPDPA